MHFYKAKQNIKTNNKFNFSQTYNIREGFERYDEEGVMALKKEMIQQHEREVFEPIHSNALTK